MKYPKALSILIVIYSPKTAKTLDTIIHIITIFKLNSIILYAIAESVKATSQGKTPDIR